MRILPSTFVVVSAAIGVAGCGPIPSASQLVGAEPIQRPTYVAAPRRGERVCIEYRDDMYGRRTCSAHSPS